MKKVIKNQLMVIFFVNVLCGSIYAQVSTPNGTSVEYFVPTYNASDAATAESKAAKWLSDRGWTNDVIKTGPATNVYNCHSYAWNMSEGITCWINAFLNTELNNFLYNNGPAPSPKNIQKYWNDSSYVEVSESVATKVWYGSCWYGGENECDHSAIRITSGTHAGKYESKWGAWPRYIHPVDKSPYVISNRKFFVRNIPIITGPTLICYGSPQPFSFNLWQPGYYWDKSSNLNLSSTSDANITASATNSNGAAGWLSVKDSNGTELLRKDVWVGPPIITIEGWEDVCAYNEYHYVATPTNILSAVIPLAYAPWTVSPSGQVVDIYRINNSHEVMISFLPWADYYEIQYQVGNDCGCGPMAYKYVWAEPCYSPSPPAYPNPVSDILHVEIDPQAILRSPTSGQNTPGVQPANPDPTFDIRLYNGQGNRVRHTASKGGTVQLNVSNLPNGLYYLHIYREKSRRPPQIQQIIVEH